MITPYNTQYSLIKSSIECCCLTYLRKIFNRLIIQEFPVNTQGDFSVFHLLFYVAVRYEGFGEVYRVFSNFRHNEGDSLKLASDSFYTCFLSSPIYLNAKNKSWVISSCDDVCKKLNYEIGKSCRDRGYVRS